MTCPQLTENSCGPGFTLESRACEGGLEGLSSRQTAGPSGWCPQGGAGQHYPRAVPVVQGQDQARAQPGTSLLFPEGYEPRNGQGGRSMAA